MKFAMESNNKPVDYDAISATQFIMLVILFVVVVAAWKFLAARYDAWWWRRFDRKHPEYRR